MSLSSTLKKVSSNILVKFGAPVTFSQETYTSFDPENGKTVSTTSTFTVNGVVDFYSKDEVNGTTILSGDIKLIIESNGNVPTNEDVATIESIDYRVMNVLHVSPAGVAIIYEVQLRV